MSTQKTGPKDVFGQLLAVVGLYVLVIAFGGLIFMLININFPDVLNYDYGYYAKESLRWPLAVLVVIFPLFLWWNFYIQRDLEQNPEKKELKIRKWLLYFTLFISAVVIVGDLVSLVFRFLNGDLTVQFILKILTVFVIAAAVFIYYLWNIKKSIPASKHPKMKWFVRAVIVVGAFFIVLGFFNAGSPFSQRLKRFDERRVQDLQTIQSEVVYFWQAKENLPQTLEELRDELRGFAPPKDPQTGEAYGYEATGALQFKLCAIFNTSNREETASQEAAKPVPLSRDVYYSAFEESWLHDKGEACFSRTIDPDLFPPLEKTR